MKKNEIYQSVCLYWLLVKNPHCLLENMNKGLYKWDENSILNLFSEFILWEYMTLQYARSVDRYMLLPVQTPHVPIVCTVALMYR